MRVLVAKPKLTLEEADALLGKKLTDQHFDTLVEDECRIIGEDGEPLAILLKKAITLESSIRANLALKKFNSMSRTRMTATDGAAQGFFRKKDGTVGTTRVSLDPHLAINGIAGYFGRTTRLPFCRQTAFTGNRPGDFAALTPFFREVSALFAEHVPKRYAAQKDFWERTSPDFRIPESVFTTVTINKNYPTACHQDGGDLKEGFSCLSILREGVFDGCHFVLPRYRVALRLDSRDLALIDPHQHHGNSPMKKLTSGATRTAMVMYYRSNMVECGSAADELKRVQERKPGDPLWDEA